MILLSERSCARTWSKAAKHLYTVPGRREFNVVLEVTEPCSRDDESRSIEIRLDSFLRRYDKLPVSSVADTIFPAHEYLRNRAEGVYSTYPDVVYPAIKRLPELRWGTYAYRLVRRNGPTSSVNQLKSCVDKINRQIARNSVKVACYELSMSDLYIDLPLYDPATDRKAHRGGPCLSHISLKVSPNRELLLTALYRSHFYVQRALGNLIGLARLQAFVCEETGLTPGALVCVSTYARLESESGLWGKPEIGDLVGA